MMTTQFVDLPRARLREIEPWWRDADTNKALGGMLPLQQVFDATPDQIRMMLTNGDQSEILAIVSLEIDGSTGHVSVVTNPEHRQNGYAKVITQNMISRSKSLGVELIEAGVEQWNTASRKLIESVGFSQTPCDDGEFLTYRYRIGNSAVYPNGDL